MALSLCPVLLLRRSDGDEASRQVENVVVNPWEHIQRSRVRLGAQISLCSEL